MHYQADNFINMLIKWLMNKTIYSGVIVGMCEILRHIDNKVNQAEILRLASQLCIIDPLRKGFYKDWSSIAN